MKKHLLMILLLLPLMLASVLTMAQTGVMRLEFPAEIDKRPYKIIPLQEDGLLLTYAQTDMLNETSRSWHFAFYDTNLRQNWEADVPILDGAPFISGYRHDNLVYFLFFNAGKVKSGANNYQISELELNSGVINHFAGFLPDVAQIRGFLVSHRKAVLACDLLNEKSSLVFIQMPSLNVNTFDIDFPDQNFVEDLQFDRSTGSVYAVISNFVSRKQNNLVVLQIDMNGNLLGKYPVDVLLPSKFLNTAKLFAAGPGNCILIGTYSNFASKIPGSNEYYGLESAGFFITRIEDGTQQSVNYINLLELTNLRSAISARDYMKLAKKKNRDEQEYSADYELMLHPIQEVNEQYVLLAEGFYPDFRTVSDISYDYWGRPITHTYTVFEGYRIFKAILLGFDKDGQLLWDNSMDMNNINTQSLSLRGGFFFDGKPAVLFYNDGNKISMRAYVGNALLEGYDYVELDTSEPGDRVVELGDNFMEKWYRNYFLCYGYHTIRNSLNTDREKRTVFYVNKLVFE